MTTHASIEIKGMTCGHCVATVEKRLKTVPGVTTAKVDLKGGRAEVDFESGRADVQAVIAAIIDEGYEARAISR